MQATQRNVPHASHTGSQAGGNTRNSTASSARAQITLACWLAMTTLDILRAGLVQCGRRRRSGHSSSSSSSSSVGCNILRSLRLQSPQGRTHSRPVLCILGLCYYLGCSRNASATKSRQRNVPNPLEIQLQVLCLFTSQATSESTALVHFASTSLDSATVLPVYVNLLGQ
jgi:hypothetical protein